MKILLYGLNYSPECVGIGKYSDELAQWLSAKGHEVHVITGQPYFPAWKLADGFQNRYKRETHKEVRVQRCPLWVPRKPNGIKRLLHLCSFALSSLGPLASKLLWSPDLVITIAPAFFCAPGAILLGSLCGKRTITWLHIQDFELDAAFELGLLKGRLLRCMAEVWERQILQSFGRVSSISSAMVTRVTNKGVKESRSYLLPNWVDLDVIKPQSETDRNKNIYRRKLVITPDKIVLMYSGSMNKKQDFDLLVNAIHQLSDLPNLVWLLAGEGPTKEKLVAATRGLQHVHHLPLQPKENLNEWLNAADIHLLPQKSEAADLVLPSKLMGIIASGRPVIATSKSGSELARIANKTGFCIEPNDTAAFYTCIRKLVSNRKLRLRLGECARRIAEQNFEKNTILSDFEKEITKLIT